MAGAVFFIGLRRPGWKQYSMSRGLWKGRSAGFDFSREKGYTEKRHYRWTGSAGKGYFLAGETGGQEEKMILVTTEFITGKELETLGMVKGAMIQSKNIVKDIGSGLKTIVGGELVAYGQMMNEARAYATKRMVDEAEAMGADAVVCVRYATSAIMQGAAEVMAYGTAVKFK